MDSSEKLKENELLIRVVFQTPSNRTESGSLKSCQPNTPEKHDTCNIIVVMLNFIMESVGKIPQWGPRSDEPEINDEGFKTMTYC
ncbi:hypothetical protein Ddc_02937 [Ditylenchus destructor]|nr:hypothetical protein Ddc_02937 [Ditylenchus destructor]